MKMYHFKGLSLSLLITLTFAAAQGQSSTDTWRNFRDYYRVITTSVPFLQIGPDARSGGMADAGSAISADANSVYWNASKLAFAEKNSGVAMNSSPWLKTLVPDIWLHYLSGFKKIDNKSAWGGSMRFFSLGTIQFTNNLGEPMGQFNPSEFSIDGAYSRKLSENFSIGVGLRFIYSNLAGRTFLVGGQQAKPGIAGAGDISLYYRKNLKLGGYDHLFAYGASLTNIGNKITYTNSTNRDFIPTNLRTGFAWTTRFDEYNELTFLTEIQKLQVPSRPLYDSARNIVAGKDPNVSVAQGIVQSWYDAPGGAKEELQEFIWQLGLEYWYAKQFAARAGFFHEAPNKGNRRYITLGVGLRYNVFGLDFAYLVPLQQRNPLENTLRVSLQFNFNETKAKPN